MCAFLDALKNERGNARESGARSDPLPVVDGHFIGYR
jgi:hypothetical protein